MILVQRDAKRISIFKQMVKSSNEQHCRTLWLSTSFVSYVADNTESSLTSAFEAFMLLLGWQSKILVLSGLKAYKK